MVGKSGNFFGRVGTAGPDVHWSRALQGHNQTFPLAAPRFPHAPGPFFSESRPRDFRPLGKSANPTSQMKPTAGSRRLAFFNRLDIRGTRRDIRPGLPGLGGKVRRSFNQDRREIGIPGGFGKRQERLGLTYEI